MHTYSRCITILLHSTSRNSGTHCYRILKVQKDESSEIRENHGRKSINLLKQTFNSGSGNSQFTGSVNLGLCKGENSVYACPLLI